ncbi:hypothetical protein ACF1AO_34760 [Streptomyces longwoodensis]|uniref:hypothetical protein n=1 Tax=Streptomyces longwoodensis TaxID=68231 RepID=UPI0036F6624C
MGDPTDEPAAADTTNEPAGVQSWWRRVPWVHVGTVIGALAAIGGLIFTAITTLYGAKVAEDQLTQSRDDSAQAKREQASRVSYWLDNDESRIHLVNRSLDPIHEVVVTFSFGVIISNLPPGRPVIFIIPLNSIPPCSELIFERGDLRWAPAKKGSFGPIWPVAALNSGLAKEFKPLESDGYLSFSAVRFADSDGAKWVRNGLGDLETEKRPERYYPLAGSMRGAVQDFPPVKPLENCTDG